jgi:3-isopropylmalate/(R)-2-methylmalate dehydratase small subunit
VPRDVHAWLFANPEAKLALDLASQTLVLPDGRRVEFPVEPFAKHCLLEGVDELGYILNQEAAIAAYESGRAISVNTRP